MIQNAISRNVVIQNAIVRNVGDRIVTQANFYFAISFVDTNFWAAFIDAENWINFEESGSSENRKPQIKVHNGL